MKRDNKCKCEGREVQKMKNFASNTEQQAGTHGCNKQQEELNRKK